jgi:hypothetical protein
MYKHWLIWLILSVLALSSLGAAPRDLAQDSPAGTIRGYVYRDNNRNGVFDKDEEGIPGVYVTISHGEYQHSYYTGEGDPEGDEPGPGSYGPTPLPGGRWTVTLHVPDGYRATSATELGVDVPHEGAVTGADFGIYGSGEIRYSAGIGVGMGGAAGALPYTGGTKQAPRGHLIALLVAFVGFLVLLGTPWCIAQTRRAYKRWW